MEQRAACPAFSGGAGSRAAAVTVGRHFAEFCTISGRPVQSSVGVVYVLMVLASELYDESDYIRNYDEFLNFVKNSEVDK